VSVIFNYHASCPVRNTAGLRDVGESVGAGVIDN